MQVAEREARDLFVALGFMAAEDERIWQPVRLLTKLNRLPDILEEVEQERIRNLKDGQHALLEQICSTLQKGSCVSLKEGDDPLNPQNGLGDQNATARTEKAVDSPTVENASSITPEEDGMSSTTEEKDQEKVPGRRGRRPKSEDGQETKPKKEKAETDKYGFRLGTETAQMNEVLSRKPKSMSELVQEAGLKRGLYGHIKRMISKGHVEEVNDNGTKKWKLAK